MRETLEETGYTFEPASRRHLPTGGSETPTRRSCASRSAARHTRTDRRRAPRRRHHWRRTGSLARRCSRASARLRSPMVIRCVDDYLRGCALSARSRPVPVSGAPRAPRDHVGFRAASRIPAAAPSAPRRRPFPNRVATLGPAHGGPIVALSGGVDSAVAALLLRDAGHDVQCLLHDELGETTSLLRRRARLPGRAPRLPVLGVPLHRVNFAREYREHVFAHFLDEHREGRTPNPDVLCNREIKFGVMRRYAQRLGAARIATGHYARRRRATPRGRSGCCSGPRLGQGPELLPARRRRGRFADVLFPLGDLLKSDVREIARRARPAGRRKEGQHRHLLHRRTAVRRIPRAVFAAVARQIVDDRGRELGAPRRARVLHARPAPRPAHRRRRGRRRGAVVCRAQGRGAQRARRRPGSRPSIAVRRVARRERTRTGSARAGRLAAGAPFRCRAKIRYRQPDQALHRRAHRRARARGRASINRSARRRRASTSSSTPAIAASAARHRASGRRAAAEATTAATATALRALG